MTRVPRSEAFDDVYFSVTDGLAETRHVFLRGNNLPDSWARKEEFTICETGFGTGLNFLAILQLMKQSPDDQKPKSLHYISFEKYPLEKTYIKEHLSHWEELESELRLFLANYNIDIKENIFNADFFGEIRLTLVFGDVNDEIPKLEACVDCWFLDGFKPSTNPDMWSDTVFQNMARLSKPGATFATFTAAGFVRRGLESVGFNVQKVPGYGRKRDMSIGVYKGTRDEG